MVSLSVLLNGPFHLLKLHLLFNRCNIYFIPFLRPLFRIFNRYDK